MGQLMLMNSRASNEYILSPMFKLENAAEGYLWKLGKKLLPL